MHMPLQSIRRRKRSLILLLLLSCYILYLVKYHDPKPRFAIVQYATDRQYLCNALINVDRLVTLETSVDLVVLLPSQFLQAKPNSAIDKIIKALQSRNVILKELQLRQDADGSIYAHSLQKLEILKLPYTRVIYFDNDALVLKNLDALFIDTPAADIAGFRAYYTPTDPFTHQRLISSAFLIIQPSPQLYQTAKNVEKSRGREEFDMEVINQIIPFVEFEEVTWRGYLLTGLFRDHASYTTTEPWDARKEIQEARYIHFSDSPIPKPWIDDRGASLAQHGPRCEEGQERCEDVEVWREVYRSFRESMRELCPSPKILD